MRNLHQILPTIFICTIYDYFQTEDTATTYNKRHIYYMLVEEKTLIFLNF